MQKTLTPRKNPLKEALQKDSLQVKIDSAFREFSPRSYAERNKGLFAFSKFSLFFFHLLSIAFAFIFVLTFFLQMIGGENINSLSPTLRGGFILAVSVVAAFVGLAILEQAKTILGKTVADSVLKKDRFNFLGAFFLILCFSFSVFSSVKGAIEIATLQTTLPEEAFEDVSSIASHYQTIISEEKEEIKAMENDPKNLVSDRGSKVLAWNVREIIKKKEARISEYISLMKEERKEAKIKNNNLLLSNGIDISKYQKTAFSISLLVECFIIILIFYKRTYLFLTYKEIEIGFHSPQKKVSPMGKKEGKKANTGGAKKMPLPGKKEKSFDSLIDGIDTETPQGAKDFAFAKKYEDLIRDNFSGASVKTLSLKYGVSDGTVKNIRKTIKKYV
jgi:hypothetical protein